MCGLLILFGCGDVQYHPEGWVRASEHGLAVRSQSEDCTLCHGDMLEGGPARVPCETCHGTAWLKDCTYCHGGVVGKSGAPPRGLQGQTSEFVTWVHLDHLGAETSAEIKCEACHVVPEEVGSPEHMFDDTPGRSEVRFGALNPEGHYDGEQLCADLYCHGNGRGVGGIVALPDKKLDCQGCHPRRRLSGEHREHFGEGVDCEDCHGDVVTSRTRVKDPSLHVNGRVDLRMPEAITREDKRCTGRCHGENHRRERW